MELYPAIDLRRGRVVRLRQGDFDAETVYGDDPIAVAREFEAAGARWIHVVDLDSARGDGSNRDIVVAIARAVGASVQTGGGVRDGSLLDDGVARVVVGSLAVNDPAATRDLVAAYPGRVAVGLDHRDGQVVVHGWEQGSGRAVRDVAVALGTPQVAAFVVTDVSRDAMLQGPDVDGLAALAAEMAVPVIASGGVSSLDDLRALRATGVAGAIVGKALYENRFTVADALAVA